MGSEELNDVGTKTARSVEEEQDQGRSSRFLVRLVIAIAITAGLGYLILSNFVF